MTEHTHDNDGQITTTSNALLTWYRQRLDIEVQGRGVAETAWQQAAADLAEANQTIADLRLRLAAHQPPTPVETPPLLVENAPNGHAEIDLDAPPLVTNPDALEHFERGPDARD